jgi:methyl-accepting chemotaxis protein
MKKSRFIPTSLGGKLIALFLALGLIPMAVIGVVAFSKASGSLQSSAQSRVDEVAFNVTDKLDRNLFERYGDVQAFAQSDPAKAMEPARLTTWMDTMMGTYTPIYNLMVVADTGGKVIAANTVDLAGEKVDTSRLIGTDVSKEPWFTTAAEGKLKPGETLVEDLHKDALTGAVWGESTPESLAMSFTYPIRADDGKIVGVWTNRFNWQVTGDILTAALERSKKAGDATAKLYVLSKQGTILASDSPADTLARPLGDLPGDVLGGRFASAGFSLYPGVSWSVVATQERSEALAAAGSLRTATLLAALVAAILLGLIAWRVARSFTRPIAALQRVTTAAAEGDFTVRADVSRTDELGRLAGSFNAMVESLAALVRRLRDLSQTVHTSVETMAQSSGQAGRATGEICQTVEGVARGAGEQAEATQVVTATVDEMAQGVAVVTAGATAAAEVAGEADQAARQGAETVQGATEAMTRIEQSVADASDVVDGMGRKSEEIGAIVATITQISDQTNLLALNAAIEAARAGEQGRGFAVVAEEVRQLAEESQRAAGSISDLIGDIQRETSRAVEAMESGRREVAEGTTRVGAAGEAFDAIREQVARLAGEVTEVAQAAEGLTTGAQRVQDGIASVAAVSEENAASAQEVAASTEEATASVDEVAGSAQQLSQNARELAELAARFRVEQDEHDDELE